MSESNGSDESSDNFTDDMVGDNSVPIEIENIYRGVYSEIRDRVLDAGLFEWTMFRFLVKSRDVRAAIKKAAAQGSNVRLEEGFELKIGGYVGQGKLTWKRLSACLLFDNCMRSGYATAKPPTGYDPKTKTFTPGPAAARTLEGMAKYVPSMSTAIPWEDIAARLPSETMRWTLLNHVRFACGPGFNFVWRIYQAENRGAEDLEEAGLAFLIGAYYLDLAHCNAPRRGLGLEPLTAAEAFERSILDGDGTYRGLLTNCADLEPPGNIMCSPRFGEICGALICPLTTIVTRAAKRRAKAAKKQEARRRRRIAGMEKNFLPESLSDVFRAILMRRT
ncbi:uncharacterized protein LOC144096978 [Amblyomma americanum]